MLKPLDKRFQGIGCPLSLKMTLHRLKGKKVLLQRNLVDIAFTKALVKVFNLNLIIRRQSHKSKWRAIPQRSRHRL